MSHEDKSLHSAETVSIDLGKHESELKNETVSKYRNDESGLNPVEIYTGIVRRIRSYPNVSDNWPILIFFDGSSFSKISGREILRDVWSYLDFIREDSFGFTSADVCTHSVCSSLAMRMFLAKEPTYTIMRIGRWRSDALLAYMENKIKEFIKGFRSRMLTNRNFYNTPLARNSRETPTHNQGTSHHHQANSSVLGRQAGSLRHHLRPRN